MITSEQILSIIDGKIKALNKRARFFTKKINILYASDENFGYYWNERTKLTGKIRLLKSIRKEIIKMSSPLDNLIDDSARCVKCGSRLNECNCWEKCKCGWAKEKGKECRNPIHLKIHAEQFIKNIELNKKMNGGL